MLVWAAAIVSAWTSSAPAIDAASRSDALRAQPLRFARVSTPTRISTARYGEQTAGAAQAVTIYGPQRFTRTAGAPNVFTATITVPAGVGAPFRLRVRNGDAGTRRVTSADLEINGARVAVASDFDPALSGFDRDVALNRTNTLRVTLRSLPASYLTLAIEGQTLDRTPPTVSVIAPPPDAVISSTTPQVVVGYADPVSDGGPSGVDVATLVVRVDGVDRTSLFTRGLQQATAQLAAGQALSDGAHLIAVAIADRAGNLGTSSAAFVVDSMAPTIETIEPPPGRFINTATPTIRVQYHDRDGVDLSTLQVVINGVDRSSLFTKTPTEAFATLGAASALPQGTVEVTSTIRDVGGNAATSTSSFVVDTEAPAIEIVQPGLEQYTAAATIDVSGTVDDSSPATVSVNGVEAAMTGSTFAAANVPVGSGPDVDLVVLATDAAGNVARSSRVVHVDREPPAVQIDQPAAGAFLSGAVIVSGTVSDASAVVVHVNGITATVSSRAFTATLSAVDGPAFVEAVAEDAAGNTASSSVAVTIDSIAPQIAIAAPAAASFLRGPSVSVTGTVSDATLARVSVNGVAATVSDGGFTAVVPVVDGEAAIVATASDRAGNSAIATTSVVIDSVPPAIAMSLDSEAGSLVRPVFVFTTADNTAIDAATFAATIDAQPMIVSSTTAVASQYTFVARPDSDLTEGEHIYAASIADRAGNTTAFAPQPYTVHLIPDGTIRGRLLAADGVTPVAGVVVTATGPSIRTAVTAADGSFQFDREDLGSYTLSATLANGSRAKAVGVVLAVSGEVVSVDLVAVAIGSVTVTVFNPDGSAANQSFVATLHSLHPLLGSFASATPATGNSFTFTSVPAGDFTIAAADDVHLYRGDASGTIVQDGQSVTITIRMASGVVGLPTTLVDANNFQFGVQPNGSVTGTNSAFSTNRFGALLDIVSSGVATRFGGAATAKAEQNRRQLVVQQTGIAGLEVTRKIFVPADGYFSRYLEVLSNSSASPITVDVRVTSTMKAPIGQRAIATSSGDSTVSVADPANPDRWVVASDTQTIDSKLLSAGPALAFVFDGEDGADTVDALAFTPNAVGQLVHQWSSVTIPAGGQLAFMHFVVMQMDGVSARASAARLVRLPQEALAGLTAADVAAIQNFAVPATGVSAVPALRLGGRVTGTVYGGDSIAPVPAATVTLRSASPYYRRAYTVTTPANGSFSFTQTLGGATNVAVPIDAFTLQASYGSIQSPEAAGGFAPQQSVAAADVAFTNAGVIRGTVRRPTGVAATGSTTLYLTNASSSVTALPPSNTYLLPVVAPGAFTLQALTSHPQGSALEGVRSGSIAAGASLVLDVILPPTGTVSGRTIVSGGAASPFGLVTITGANGFTRRTQSDASGNYTLTDVPAGGYTLSATQSSTNIAAANAQISVAADTTTIQDAVFPGTGTVTGTITFADGTIANSVQVALSGSGMPSQLVLSNAFGVYAFTNVPTGRAFTVRATSPTNSQLYRDVAGTLTSDGQILTLNVVLPARATVLVTLAAPSGAPVEGSSVTLVDAIGAASVAVTNASGAVAFANVPEGSFAVTAADPQGLRGMATGHGAITLADQGGTVSIHLVQPLIVSVAGHVYAADGQTPIADARLWPMVADRSVVASSGPDGYYAFSNLSADSNTITIRVDSPFTFAPVETRTFTIESDRQLITADFSLPYAAVRGVITFADGRVAASPSVTVTQTGADGYAVIYSATSDAAGNYTFAGLSLGEFSVTAQEFTTGLTASASGRIESLEAGAALNLSLQSSGSVVGAVRDSAGAPIALASVTVTSSGLNYQRLTLTDDFGRYRVDDVALGAVTVQSFVSPFSVTARGELSSMGEVVTIDLTPPPSGTVSGIVRDAVGAPVAGARVFIEDALGVSATSALTDVNGAYSATWMAGPLRVTALRTADLLNAGVIEATLDAGGHVAVDVALGNAVYAFAKMALPAADGFVYKVECDGSIAAGGTADGRLASPYSSTSYAMIVDGVAPGCRRSLLLEENRQQVVAGPERDGPVTVTRKTFVPAGGSFVRMVDSVTNPTAAEVTIAMAVTATLTSSSSTHVVVAPGPSTPYAVTDGGAKPALAHVFGGDGALVSASATHVASGDSQLSYRWTVTIPAGQTISVMHFSAQRDAADAAGARAAAEALSTLSVPGALAGLTAEERARIINFRVP